MASDPLDSLVQKRFSHYEIIEKLGEGGMGAVYLANDLELRRQVALKFLPKELTKNEGLKARFKREAQAAAALNHPNIITVYEVGEHDGYPYIAMEFVQGKSLYDLLHGKELNFERSIEIFIQVCEAMSVAHRNNIVHRDIKPANVMLDQYGKAKILDFGLAKLQGATQLTREGTTMGTPHYMSPEQIRGQDVDYRSDIFSLGVLLYELLTGKLPFKGENPTAICYAIVHEKPLPLQEYLYNAPRSIQKIIDRALEKSPDKRYQSSDELLADVKKERESLHKFYIATQTSMDVGKPAKKKRPLLYYFAPATLIVLAALLYATGLHTQFIGYFQAPPAENNETKTLEPLETKFAQNQPEPASAQTPSVPSEKVGNPPEKNENDREQPKETEPVDKANAEQFGSMEISSVPVGAQLYLNGRKLGEAPYEEDRVKADSYELLARLSGYPDKTQKITVRPEQNNSFLVRFDVPMGGISFTSQPSGATIYLNGNRSGTTPRVVQNLTTGRHSIVIRKNGYKDFKANVSVAADEVELVNAKLQPLVGKANILVKPFGSIYIDGSLHKRNYQFRYETELSAGRHIIQAVHPSFGSWQKEINIEANKEETITIDFTQTVDLTVAAKPVWGTIYVDDVPNGETPKVITVRIGQHTINVRRSGYETVGGARTINIEEGFKGPLVFELKEK